MSRRRRASMSDRILAMQGKAVLSKSLEAVDATPAAPTAAHPDTPAAAAVSTATAEPAAAAGAGMSADGVAAGAGGNADAARPRRATVAAGGAGRVAVDVRASTSLWKRFPKLRDSKDYAKGSIFHKSKLAKGMLEYNSKHVPKSLVLLNDESAETRAVVCNSYLHDFTNGKPGSVDAARGLLSFLGEGLLKKNPFVDELYLQLCKHWNGVKKASVARRTGIAWCWAVDVLAPSDEIAPYVTNFLISKLGEDKDNLYAKYALQRFRLLVDGDDDHEPGEVRKLPRVEDVLASENLTPFVCDLQLVHGEVLKHNFLVPIHASGAELVPAALELAGVDAGTISYLGLFVERVALEDGARDHVHPRIWRQVEDGALVCEVIHSMTLDSFGFRLVVKPKVVAGDDDDVYSTDDTRYNEMLFHELADSIHRGTISVVTQEEMLPLLAMSLASSRGSTTVGALHDADVDVMAACVPQRLWKGVAHKKEWIAAVTPECRALAGRLETIEDVHAEYIGIVSALPGFGQSVTNASLLRGELAVLLEEITGEAQDSDRPFDVLTLYLGVGLIGVTVFHDDGGLLVSHGAIPYEKIMEWHGSEQEFMMRIPSETLVGNEEVVFLVAEGSGMATAMRVNVKYNVLAMQDDVVAAATAGSDTDDIDDVDDLGDDGGDDGGDYSDAGGDVDSGSDADDAAVVA